MGSRSDSGTGRVRRWPALLVGLAVALGSAACTSDDDPPADEAAPVVQLGAPGEAGKTLSPDEAEAIDEPTWTDADVEFVQMMIPHHQQALEMTALVEDRAADPDLAQLAERIEVSQQDEIALLEKWLSQRGEMVSGMHGITAGTGSTAVRAATRRCPACSPPPSSTSSRGRRATGSTGCSCRA